MILHASMQPVDRYVCVYMYIYIIIYIHMRPCAAFVLLFYDWQAASTPQSPPQGGGGNNIDDLDTSYWW